jgi:hypothetical protein
MEKKTTIWIGMTAGSLLGSYLPSLWGGSLFSFSGVLLSALGGALGIWIGYTQGN